MASNTVEQIFVEVLLKSIGFSKGADEVLKKNKDIGESLDSTKSKTKEYEKSISELSTALGRNFTAREREAKRVYDLDKAYIEKSYADGKISLKKKEDIALSSSKKLFEIQKKSLEDRINLAKSLGDDAGVFDNKEKLRDLVNNQKILELQASKTTKGLSSVAGGISKVIKGVAGLAAVVAAGTGLLRIADEAKKANEELNILSQNLGMASRDVKAWQGAASAMGGSAKGMAGDMQSLNNSMNDFKMTGESSMLPMFNTLGVAMIDAQGKVRDTDKVMLDLADSMSKMNREEAVLMGKKLGLDDGTINTLIQGRDAMQQMVDYHKQMYSSSKEELRASRQLSENQAKLGAHWDSMKLMIGNAVIPLLVKLSEVALRFFEFLQKHQKTVKNVFEGMAIVLGALVVPMLGKALIALTLFIAPFLPFIGVVGLLSAAFIALYDDYKTWAEGGQSLFNWGAFSGYIDNSNFSVSNLGKGFLNLVTGYSDWSKLAEDGKSWLKMKGFIDENGVSIKSLINGFQNLGSEIMREVIPTLQGYASIIKKIFEGNFSGAWSEAKEMGQEFWKRVKSFGSAAYERVTDSVDVATGQEKGTLAAAAGGLVNDYSNQSGTNPILELLNKGETGGKSGAAAYNTAFTGMRIKAPKNLTEMTIDEVKAWQKQNLDEQAGRGIAANRRSSAAGRYQVLYSSMDGYAKGAGLKGSDLFSAENQNKMAMAMLKGGAHGLDNVKSGKATQEQFIDSILSKQWASVQSSKGVGIYDKPGFNKASITPAQSKAAISAYLKGGESAQSPAGNDAIKGASKKAVAAADFAVANALDASAGKCAKYVNDSLRAQGLKINGHGKDVADNLIKSGQGFSKVAYNENYKPKIGDVMSMGAYSAAHKASQLKRHGVEAGHVAIYTKNGWVSDFKQGEKYGNTGAANKAYHDAIKGGTLKPTIARKQDDANFTSSAISMGASNAYRSTAQGNMADLRSLTASSQGGRGSSVDVSMGDIKVYTTASTISGTMSDAMSAATNSITQIAGSMA